MFKYNNERLILNNEWHICINDVEKTPRSVSLSIGEGAYLAVGPEVGLILSKTIEIILDVFDI